MTDWFQLLGGGLLLYFGAEWFVGGASSLAMALRVPRLIVGLTVVAYGTSAPEVMVGVQAALTGHGAVALGNVIGSNIANIGLILGVAALVKPAKVDGALRHRELPVLVVSTAIVPLLLLDGSVRPWEAGALLLAACCYTAWILHAARAAAIVEESRVGALVAELATDTAGAPRSTSRWRAGAVASVGLVVLLVGSSRFVEGAVGVAQTLGMSERLVGLTIVAVGTSLPELVTSVVAALRGHSDIAIGNVIGSNVFNVFLCLGAAGLAGSVGAPLPTLAVDLVALVTMTVLAGLFLRSERTVSRAEGAIALAMYATYIVATAMRG